MAARPGASGQDRRQVLAALEGKPALYHCISRAVWQEMVFGPEEKEHFVMLLRRWEAFSQVRVLTFCIMTNHFHILVEVPERPKKDPSDEELLEHLGLIYRGQRLAMIRWTLENFRAQGNHKAAEALRQRILRRMWDLSRFMKALKQDYTVWWNKRHKKRGNLWEERFKSVLVEDGHAARIVAAYIDLNPVRAGIVKTPEDYRWSGYGEARAGKVKARGGIRQVMLERELACSNAEAALDAVADWRRVLKAYRAILLADAEKRSGALSASQAGERVPPGRRSRFSEGELLQRRVRYFVDGMVIGSKGFVDDVFVLTREWFASGRRNGARRLPGAETPLHAMRALRVDPYG